MQHKHKPMEELENDELDQAVMNADDTGMISAQHVAIEEELTVAEEGLTGDEESTEPSSGA